MKKMVMAGLVMVLLGVLLLAGCGAGGTEEKTEVSETAPETEGKTVVLVVSFGTSYNDSRELTIGGIEKAIQDQFPSYEVRRAFTSQIIIDKLKERDGIEIDNVTEALDRAVADGVTTLIVQPTHLMHGYEYTDLADELAGYTDKIANVVMGEPLLNTDEDFERVADVLAADTASYDDGETAVVFMGHGTEADSNEVYAKMQTVMEEKGMENYYVGTVEATPSLDDVIASLKGKGYKRVVLEPLMVVAGDHANNDMAGDEDDSWKSILNKEGYETECILEGLGQKPEIQQIYVDHVKAAAEELN